MQVWARNGVMMFSRGLLLAVGGAPPRTARADSVLIARSVSISCYRGIHWLLTDGTIWKNDIFPDLEEYWT